MICKLFLIVSALFAPIHANADCLVGIPDVKGRAYYARIDTVIDGDTVDLYVSLGFDIWQKTRIRIRGIDAPETRTRDLTEKSAGLLAKSRVMDLLPVGSVVRIVGTESDKYGRTLADIINGEKVSVSEYLLSNRLAVPYEGKSKSDIGRLHQENFNYLLENGYIK